MAKLADAIALGAIGATLGGSNPLPPIDFWYLSFPELYFIIREGVTGARKFVCQRATPEGKP